MKKIFAILLTAMLSVSAFAEEVTIWEGSHNCANWVGNQDLGWGKYDWSKVTAGTVIRVYFTQDNTKEYWQLTVGVAGDDWKAICTGTNCVNLTSGQTVFEHTLDQADVTRLVTLNGMAFNGANITVTKITLDGEPAPEPETDDIDLSANMTCIWNAAYDTATTTITWSQDWGGAGWWYGDDSEGGSASKDCSAYTKVVLEFATAAPANGAIEIAYVGEGNNGEAGFEAGATKAECFFDATRSNHVKDIVMKLASAGSITLSKAYFVKVATGVDTITTGKVTRTVKVFDNGTLTIKTADSRFNIAGQRIK